MDGTVESLALRTNTGGDSSPDATPPRTPITQEFMVESILAERRGDGPAHPASKFFPDVLFESIESMVGMLSARYVALSGSDEKDLSQMCMSRIWEKLDTYKPNKAKFSTWAWTVCMRVIWKECRSKERFRKVFVDSEKVVELNARTESPHAASCLRGEIQTAVAELLDRYPEREPLIVELFGNPRDNDYVPFAKICFAKSARTLGISSSDVASFYKRKAQPFLQRKLGKV